MALNSFAVEQPGESVEPLVLGLDLVRFDALGDAVRGQRARDLADVPFHRVEPVAAVGDVGGADVLSGGQQIADAARYQRAEGISKGTEPMSM